MESNLIHLNEVSVFGRSTVALFLIVGADLAFTLIHSLEEWKGSKAPLWRVFGAIVGLSIQNWVGLGLFTLGLTGLLWVVGLMAITGWAPIYGAVGPAASTIALGALMGARIGDTLVSHWLLFGVGYRPNPGLASTPLYLIEAAFLFGTFQKGLVHGHCHCLAWEGFIGGCLFFCAVLPTFWLFRTVVPSWRCPRWPRGTPLPV